MRTIIGTLWVVARTDKLMQQVSVYWREKGLAVTSAISAPQSFTVTHVNSGFALQEGIGDCEQAIILAESIAMLADWSAMSLDDMVRASEVRTRVKALGKKVLG